MYQPQGGRINNRAGVSMTGQAYQQEAGVSTAGQVYQQGAGVSTAEQVSAGGRVYRQGAGVSTTGRVYQQEVGVSTAGRVYRQRVVYVSTIGHLSSFFAPYLVSCRYGSMYLSSSLNEPKPSCFYEGPFSHILPLITGYNQLLTGCDRD